MGDNLIVLGGVVQTGTHPHPPVVLGGGVGAIRTELWWNFVARSNEDIVQAREEWMTGSRFGEVHGYDGPPIPAPELPPVALKPRGRVR